MPKALPLHHPTADDRHHAHAFYTQNEAAEYAHRLTRDLLEGTLFTDGQAIHALLRIWSPKGPKFTPADITVALDQTAAPRGAFTDRHIATPHRSRARRGQGNLRGAQVPAAWRSLRF